MRRLDLRNYQVTQKVRTGSGEVREITAPYMVKDSILNIMFLPELRLKGAELVRQNILAMKIEQSGDSVLLEDAEYERIKTAAENYTAQGRHDVELIDRILNQTPEIE